MEEGFAKQGMEVVLDLARRLAIAANEIIPQRGFTAARQRQALRHAVRLRRLFELFRVKGLQHGGDNGADTRDHP